MDLYAFHTDNQLICLIKQSDDKAFTELYNRYWQKLFSVAANKLHDYAEAEELVQNIFLDIWNRKSSIEITGELKSYLSVAMKYQVINVLAKRNQQLQYKRYATQSIQVADQSTEQWLSFEELKDRLAVLVNKLPDKCRLVYQLSREADYSHKEIAKELKISEKTVESHLTRALKAIRMGFNLLFLFFILLLRCLL